MLKHDQIVINMRDHTITALTILFPNKGQTDSADLGNAKVSPNKITHLLI